MKQTASIIGFGRFGKFAASHLKEHFQIVVYDPDTDVRIPRQFKRVTLRQAAMQKLVVICVPVNRLQAVLKAISRYVQPGALVCDICAVKTKPVAWMKKLLPRHAHIVGTHPLFGPDSAADGLKGHHIVISPVRIPFRQLQVVHTSLRKAGLKVHHMSSNDHDKLMAQTLFLTQFIGRSAAKLEPPVASFTTPNYRLLHTIIQRSTSDSFELFKDVYRYNPYAERILRNVIRETLRLERQIA